MKFFTTTLLAFSLAAVGAFAQNSNGSTTINTPQTVTECQPTKISWDIGTAVPPLYISVFDGANPSGDPVMSFPVQNSGSSSSLTWNVNIPANTVVFLRMKDSTGNFVESGRFTIGAGQSDTSCLSNKSTSVSNGPSASTGMTSSSMSSKLSSLSTTPTSAKTPSPSGTSTISSNNSTSDATALHQFGLQVAMAAIFGVATHSLVF